MATLTPELANRIQRFQAKWQLQFAPPEAVPSFAADMLDLGLEASAAAELAALVNPVRPDVDPVFRRLMLELRLPEMTDDEARWLLVRAGVRAICDGTLQPREGADQIAFLCEGLGLPEVLRPFLYFSSDYDMKEAASWDAAIRSTSDKVRTALNA